MATLYDLLAPGQPSRMGMIEADPDYDPYSMQAARVRRRYPTRMPDPRALAASQGAVGFADLPGFPEARQQAMNVYAGEEYNPSSLVQMAMGAVGAPGMVGGVPAGALGSGVGRRPLPGAPPVLDPSLARRIQGITRREGGSTTSLASGERPSEGLMMGIYRNEDPRTFVTDKPLSLLDLERFAQTNQKPLAMENRYLGTWRDPATGKSYLDVSQRFSPDEIRQATKFGERTGQIAGWNVGANQRFPVGNGQQFIQSPEFHQRMREMEAVGQQYLSQHPTREWWTNEPFVRVYGEQNMPASAGYTAATAPNAAPRENLQTASEYMRRHIQGEPIIQPDWRVPEGMMTRQAGGQIGMEESRKPNLLKAQRGDLAALQRDKVREEAFALTGDPNAVVLDRHQARLSEAPARGIFANAQEGVVSSAPKKGPTDYQLLKAEFVKAAQTAGRDPRDFSADVWTGIRETIKNTSELYGTKYRGAAVSGESKSYADHFDDLISDKAKHLGITVSEMEKRLRNGDANLLSWLAATTPAVYEAYRQWQAPQSEAPSSDRSQRRTDAL
jgi:hypothetical protein